jgi:hypothetical protein
MRATWILAALLPLAGCGAEPASDDDADVVPDAAPRPIEVQAGFHQGTFHALTDGATVPLVLGPQGGTMILASARVVPPGPVDPAMPPPFHFEFTAREGDQQVGKIALDPPMTADGDGFVLATPAPIILVGVTRPEMAAGHEVDIDVDATLPGAEGRAQVRVSTTYSPPSQGMP